MNETNLKRDVTKFSCVVKRGDFKLLIDAKVSESRLLLVSYEALTKPLRSPEGAAINFAYIPEENGSVIHEMDHRTIVSVSMPN